MGGGGMLQVSLRNLHTKLDAWFWDMRAEVDCKVETRNINLLFMTYDILEVYPLSKESNAGYRKFKEFLTSNFQYAYVEEQ